MNEWINVKERLPDKSGKYSIKGIKGSIDPRKFEDNALFKINRTGGLFLYGFDWCTITHWKEIS